MFPEIGDGLPAIREKQILEDDPSLPFTPFVPFVPAAPTANIVAVVQLIVLEVTDADTTRLAVAAHKVKPGEGDVPGVRVHPAGAAPIVFVAQV